MFGLYEIGNAHAYTNECKHTQESSYIELFLLPCASLVDSRILVQLHIFSPCTLCSHIKPQAYSSAAIVRFRVCPRRAGLVVQVQAGSSSAMALVTRRGVGSPPTGLRAVMHGELYGRTPRSMRQLQRQMPGVWAKLESMQQGMASLLLELEQALVAHKPRAAHALLLLLARRVCEVRPLPRRLKRQLTLMHTLSGWRSGRSGCRACVRRSLREGGRQ